MKGRWGSPTGCPMAVGYQGVQWQDKGNGFKLNKGGLRLDSGLHVGRTHAQNSALCSPCCIGFPWCLLQPLLPFPRHCPDALVPPHSNPLFSLRSQFSSHLLNGRNSHLRPSAQLSTSKFLRGKTNFIQFPTPAVFSHSAAQFIAPLQVHGGSCPRAVLMLGHV